ncbi:MAG: NADH-quinone oxidoreductase subunit C [Candidatus Bathyarchaeota archaeon]|nr:NADH-quinone oxidoreductase subunit C [Candidatus Bathyarchaeota archaeon]
MLGAKAEIYGRLTDRFRHRILEFSAPRANSIFIRIGREDLKEAVQFLVNEGFNHLSAITALKAGESIEILYHLSGKGLMVTLRIALPPSEDTVPTITDIIPGALLHEREVHDLFGIKFEGNPDLRPLILPEDWPADVHPMRRK